MLEREKTESGRATSVIRMCRAVISHLILMTAAKNLSSWIVYYVRNPPGSQHKPFSADDCTILVKLWQMEPEDDNTNRIDTNFTDWLPGQVEGLMVLSLYERDPEHVVLVHWQLGTTFQHYVHPGGE